MTADQVFFTLFATGAVAGALGVIASRNPVNSAISLVCAFFCLAGTYVLLQAHLMAILQILVYAGAIMVLFLFVLMLLNLGEQDMGRPRFNIVKALGAVGVFGLSATVVGAVVGSSIGTVRIEGGGLPSEFGTVEAIGGELMTRWVLPFELVGVLLLVGIVGAVVAAKRRL